MVRITNDIYLQMKDFLFLELKENNQLNFVQWLIKYPRQTIIIVLKIMFTQLIEQHSKGNDLEQVYFHFHLFSNEKIHFFEISVFYYTTPPPPQ